MFLLLDDHDSASIHRDSRLFGGEADKDCLRLHCVLLSVLCLFRHWVAGSSGTAPAQDISEAYGGIDSLQWLYPTEINSLSMRTKGAAIGTATNWIFNFMGMLSPTLS